MNWGNKCPINLLNVLLMSYVSTTHRLIFPGGDKVDKITWLTAVAERFGSSTACLTWAITWNGFSVGGHKRNIHFHMISIPVLHLAYVKCLQLVMFYVEDCAYSLYRSRVYSDQFAVFSIGDNFRALFIYSWRILRSVEVDLIAPAIKADRASSALFYSSASTGVTRNNLESIFYRLLDKIRPKRFFY